MLDAVIQCPICEKSGYTPLVAQPEDYEYRISIARTFQIFQCTGCASRFLWPRPSIEELKSFYPKDYHAYYDEQGWIVGGLMSLRDKSRKEKYFTFTDHRPIRLFDVGCGNCRQFNTLRAGGGFQFSGVEINSDMVAIALDNGYDVLEGTLEEMNLDKIEHSFDIVTMYQLVEHVLKPNLLFSQALRLLKPGGVVIGQLPCLDSLEARFFGQYWAGYHFPRHLQHFTRKSISDCLARQGFDQIKVGTALHLQAALSLQNYIVGKLSPCNQLCHGKVGYYTYLLLAAAPFCCVEYVVGRGGMMNFFARSPKR